MDNKTKDKLIKELMRIEATGHFVPFEPIAKRILGKKRNSLDKTALMSKEARADFKFEQKRKLKITAKRAELEKFKDKLIGMKEFSKEEKLLILEMFGCCLGDYYGGFDGELFCDYLERADKQRKALRRKK